MTDTELAAEIKWAPLSSYWYWSTYLEGVKVGNKSIPISVTQAVFDSGASLCYVPTQEYVELIKEITEGKNCWYVDTIDIVCSCPLGERDYASYPTIYIDLGSLVLKFEGNWYMQHYNNYYGYKDVCLVMFLDGGIEGVFYWLMGDAFLRAYLTIYDRDNNKIGFVGNAEEQPIPMNYTAMVIVGISVTIGLTVGLICLCVVGCKVCQHFRKKKDNQT